jgi:hypothetical protein
VGIRASDSGEEKGSLNPYLKGFHSDSFLPFQAPVAVCQKEKRI